MAERCMKSLLLAAVVLAGGCAVLEPPLPAAEPSIPEPDDFAITADEPGHDAPVLTVVESTESPSFGSLMYGGLISARSFDAGNRQGSEPFAM